MTTATAQGLEVPVLFLIFNRPDSTRLVFDRIRMARPAEYYVAGDGPRPNFASDVDKCELAREIATFVDWPCRIKTRFQDENSGPGQGVSSAITWFFEHVEEGIILEDDCVPHPSFFRFCQELLSRYRTDARVMHITGHNYQYGRRRGRASYYFSTYTHVGGWATWRRAWSAYDITLIPSEERYEIWDAAWMFSVWRAKALAVVPNVNLVTNVGFGDEATHTKTMGRFAHIPENEMRFPMTHPSTIAADSSADRLTYYANFRNIPSLRLMWLHQIGDFVRLIAPRGRKMMARVRGWLATLPRGAGHA